MPQTSELMAQGMPAALADGLGVTPLVHVIPIGSTQTGAALLTSTHTILDSASTAGVRLPQASNQDLYVVYNNSGASQNVYPAVGETINASTANTAFSVTNGKAAFFFPSGTAWLANLSA